MSLIENLQPNQQLLLPGGWQRTEYGYLCIYILRNCGGNNTFSFTVCNTGRHGLQYHPSSFDSETGRQLKQMVMKIWNIPALRIMDSTFWVVFLRIQVYPSKRNSAKFSYTKLLPSLNVQPLLSNLDQRTSWVFGTSRQNLVLVLSSSCSFGINYHSINRS